MFWNVWIWDKKKFEYEKYWYCVYTYEQLFAVDLCFRNSSWMKRMPGVSSLKSLSWVPSSGSWRTGTRCCRRRETSWWVWQRSAATAACERAAAAMPHPRTATCFPVGRFEIIAGAAGSSLRSLFGGMPHHTHLCLYKNELLRWHLLELFLFIFKNKYIPHMVHLLHRLNTSLKRNDLFPNGKYQDSVLLCSRRKYC